MREVSAEMMFKVQCSGLEVAERKMLIPFFTRCACVALLSIAVLAVVSHASAQQGTRVRIGLAGRNFSFRPFFVAEQQKFFEQEGIRAEMIYMRSPVAIPALSAGEIQYTTHFASVLRSAVKGFPVRVILSTSDRQMFSLVAAKSIKSIADLKGLKASEERGRGNRTTIIEIGCSALIAHMSQFSVGRYKKAHRHAAGAQIIILEGAGYSLLWPEGSEAKRFDWQPNSVISPPDQWFHQHFNTSQNETRYLAIRWNSKKYKVFKDIVDRSVKEGGTQIEYEDEDPKVRQLFETELARRGIQSRMT